MDFKEYIKIFKNNYNAFITVLAIFLVSGLVFFLFQENNFKANLTLNISRIGTQKTDSYKYDDFYRLQADERFADTVVRWLGSPRIATNILNNSGLNNNLSQRALSKFFKAKRLSSQMIEINFVSKDEKTAKKISDSTIKILNKESEKLNEQQKEEQWFTIIGDEPVISVGRQTYQFIFSVSVLLGIFFGIWTVYLKHYFSK